MHAIKVTSADDSKEIEPARPKIGIEWQLVGPDPAPKEVFLELLGIMPRSISDKSQKHFLPNLVEKARVDDCDIDIAVRSERSIPRPVALLNDRETNVRRPYEDTVDRCPIKFGADTCRDILPRLSVEAPLVVLA
jgi:hypothetical protein